ncbi:MAG: glycosyltransferase 87 family protein [Solirubrobacterales bacterium]
MTARRLLVAAMLVLMVAAALYLVAGAAAFRAGPLIRNHTPLDSSLRGAFSGLGFDASREGYAASLVVLTLCYLGILALADSISARVAVAAIVVLYAIFAIGPPLLSSDIFNYIGYARLDAVHHLSPYEFALNRAPEDPSYAHVGWAQYTTPYGPLFTLISLPLAAVGLATAVWLMKAVAALSALGCLALVWLLARRLGREPLPAVLFVGLNPLVLVFAVGGGHNDFLMMLAALGGIYFLLDGREEGVVGLVAAGATKASGAIFLPFAILGSERRGRALVLTLVAGAVAAAVSVAIFGIHLLNAGWIAGNAAHIATPINFPGFVFNDVLPFDFSTNTLNRIGIAVAVPAVILLLLRVYRGADWLEMSGWAVFAGLASTTWLLPWYLMWWLPVAAVAGGRRQRYAALAFSVLIAAIEVSLILKK